jgi:two-component system, oxyanion-binding sensor
MTADPVLRIRLVRLTDAAPLIMARELGYFAAEDLEVSLSIEPSWANIADNPPMGCWTVRCCCRRSRSPWSLG